MSQSVLGWRRRWMAAGCAVAMGLLAALLALPAGAHEGHDHGASADDGRIPGMPDRLQVGKAVSQFRTRLEEYEVRRPNRPAAFLHAHSAPEKSSVEAWGEGKGEVAAGLGAGVGLPEAELDPVCKNTGSRVVVVYTHRASDTTPTPVEFLRSKLRRMNWKIADESSKSSEGSRVVRMAVECDSEGEIKIHDVVAPPRLNYLGVFQAVAEDLFGYPKGLGSAIKYLVLDAEPGQDLAELIRDNSKGPGNEIANWTGSALNYAPTTNSVGLHELFHTFGATQGQTQSPPPFSGGAHCVDGIDILCYGDGTISPWGNYTETRCPKSEGYETPLGVPLDCGKDTYFNADPEPESWLAEHWNVAGPENPFLVAPPKVTTESPLAIGSTAAFLGGTLHPEGYNVEYRYEYGPTEAYGSTTPVRKVAFGDGAIEAPEILHGLEPSTEYHYRLVAEGVAGTAVGEDETFTTGETMPTPPQATTDAASSLSGTGATLNGTIDPEGSAVSYYFEYGTSNAYGKKIPLGIKVAGSGSTGIAVSQVISGLSPNTKYHYRVVAENIGGISKGEDRTLTTLKFPKATTESAGEVKVREATLQGTVNPEGTATSYYFEYGISQAYGTKVPVTPAAVGSGTSAVPVSQVVEGLLPERLYHYRLVAESAAGKTIGANASFTTRGLPAARTGGASSIELHEAVLSGTVNPETSPTTYYFQYGKTKSYGGKVPAVAKEAGSGAEDVGVTEPVEGLEAGTTYHYRLVAQSEEGTTFGKDMAFTTGYQWFEDGNPLGAPASIEFEGEIGFESELGTIDCDVSSTLDIGPGGSGVVADLGSTGAEACETTGLLVEFECEVQSLGLDSQPAVSGDAEGLKVYDVAMSLSLGPAGCALGEELVVECKEIAAAPDDISAFEQLTLDDELSECTNPEVGSFQVSGTLERQDPPKLEGSFGFENENGKIECDVFGDLHLGSGGSGTLTGFEVGDASEDCETTGPLAEIFGCNVTSVEPGPPASVTADGTELEVSGLEITFGMNWAEGCMLGADLVMECDEVSATADQLPYPGELSFGEDDECETGLGSVVLSGALEVSGSSFGFGRLDPSWAPQSPPAGPLTAISCAASNFCMGVRYSGGLEIWNGSKWTPEEIPSPPPGLWLTNVSCASTEDCVTVGFRTQEGKSIAISERWDGSGWHEDEIPLPAGGSEGILESVSCAAADDCMAVGYFSESKGKESLQVQLAAHWDGSEWTPEAVPGFGWNGSEYEWGAPSSLGSLVDVSCGSTTSCIGVGEVGPTTTIVLWDGSEWASEEFADPNGGDSDHFASVSCWSAEDCMAVGNYYSFADKTNLPLAARWDGTEWAVQKPPKPAGTPKSMLLDVSCTSGTDCTAIGHGFDTPFAERWDGSQWSAEGIPLPEGSTSANVYGEVSCSAPDACTATDAYWKEGSAHPLIERWE